MSTEEFDSELLEDLYMWIDEVPLTRPKRDLKRDFADGVMIAELIKYFFPHLVDLHNYPPALSVKKKMVNWDVLNRRIFIKLGFEVSPDVIRNIVESRPFAIEQLLLLLRKKIEHHLHDDKTEADQDSLSKTPPNNVQSKKGREDSPPTKKPIELETKAPPTQPETNKQRNILNNKPVDNSKTRPSFSQANGRQNHEKPPLCQPPQIGRSNQTNGRVVHESVSMSQLLEEKEHQLINKDEVIDILQAKVRRLENLLQLKEVRIEDLQQQIANLKPKKRIPPPAL